MTSVVVTENDGEGEEELVEPVQDASEKPALPERTPQRGTPSLQHIMPLASGVREQVAHFKSPEAPPDMVGSTLLKVPEDVNSEMRMLMEYAVQRDGERDLQLIGAELGHNGLWKVNTNQWFVDKTVEEWGSFPVLPIGLSQIKKLRGAVMTDVKIRESYSAYFPAHHSHSDRNPELLWSYVLSSDGYLVGLGLDPEGQLKEVLVPAKRDMSLQKVELPNEEQSDHISESESTPTLDENPLEWMKGVLTDVYQLEPFVSPQGRLFVLIGEGIQQQVVYIEPEALVDSPLRPYFEAYFKAAPVFSAHHRQVFPGSISDPLSSELMAADEVIAFDRYSLVLFRRALASRFLNAFHDEKRKRRAGVSKEAYHEELLRKGPPVKVGGETVHLMDRARDLFSAKTMICFLDELQSLAEQDVVPEEDFLLLKGRKYRALLYNMFSFALPDELSDPELHESLRRTRAALGRSPAVYQGKRLIDFFDPVYYFSREIGRRHPIHSQLNEGAMALYREGRQFDEESARQVLERVQAGDQDLSEKDARDILTKFDDPDMVRALMACYTPEALPKVLLDLSATPGLSRSAILAMLDRVRGGQLWENLLAQEAFPYDSSVVVTLLREWKLRQMPEELVVRVITHPSFPMPTDDEALMNVLEKANPVIYQVEMGELDFADAVRDFFQDVESSVASVEELQHLAAQVPWMAMTIEKIPIEESFKRSAVIGSLITAVHWLIEMCGERSAVTETKEQLQQQMEFLQALQRSRRRPVSDLELSMHEEAPASDTDEDDEYDAEMLS